MSKVTVEVTCYHINRSIEADNTGRNGGYRVVSVAAQAALLTWVLLSSHLASARLKGEAANLTDITVFFTTFDAGEDA